MGRSKGERRRARELAFRLLYEMEMTGDPPPVVLRAEEGEEHVSPAVREYAAVLLDLATLAVKLDKPLTARLLPIPGLAAGDMTRFNFEYFANAQVMDVGASAVKIFETNVQVEFK